VLLGTPEIWSDICDDMSPYAVEACLDRSGGMPLEVFLDSLSNVQTYPQFYEEQHLVHMITSSSHRWNNLVISVAAGDVERRSPLEDLSAPLLRTLTINFPLKSLLERSNSEPRMPICDEWIVPRLQSLNVYQLMPPPFQHATSLRRLHIELGDRNHLGEGWILNIDALGQFLRSFPLLANLEMQIVGPQTVINPHRPSPFCLQNVETVTLSFPSCRSSVIEYLLADVRFPKATNMILSFWLGLKKGHTLTTRMSAIFSNRSVFPNVVNLKLAVKCSEGERVPSDRAFPISRSSLLQTTPESRHFAP